MKRTLWTVAVAAVLLAALVGSASAVGGLTLSSSKTTVRYPHRFVLTVGYPTADPANRAAILQRIAGASEWTTVSASVATTRSVKPKFTAAYVAVFNGEQSDPVTVTVSAHLTKPSFYRRGQLTAHGHKRRTVAVKGMMSPVENKGQVVVTFYLNNPVTRVVGQENARHTIHVANWVEKESRVVDLNGVHGNKNWSKWSTNWAPNAKGTWKIVVSHEDVTHLYSSASRIIKVKR